MGGYGKILRQVATNENGVCDIGTGPVCGISGGGAGASAGGAAKTPSLFVAADRCSSCHNALTTPSGKDVSVGKDSARA